MGAVENYVETHRGRLEARFGPLSLLGDGAQGMVYRLRDRPDRVLKISHARHDVILAHYLWRHPARYMRHLPVFYEAYWDDDGDIFLTVREELASLRSPRGVTNDIMVYMEHTQNVAVRDGDSRIMLTRALEDIRATRAPVGSLPGHDEKILEAIAALMLWGHEHRFAIGDLHYSNLGQRADGTVVIRDVGLVTAWAVQGTRGWMDNVRHFATRFG